MTEPRKLSCYLMGHQSRLILCAELLLEKGHQICGIISDVPSIQNWTRNNNLRLMIYDDSLLDQLKQQPFDLFLSIDNFLKVPSEFLTLPRMFAINFHDASLPKYAGINATNWALINRETSHGVTWHVMTDLIDSGDILKQRTIPISDGETALTLNAKCYEVSIQSFAELIDELAEDRVKPIQQDLEKRTFFPQWKRPYANCTIDWTRSAEEICALFHGLDHGSYLNPLGLPKIFLGNDTVIVKQIDRLESIPGVAPGTITLVRDGTINVASATNEVRLSKFYSSNGAPLFPSEILVKYGLNEGSILPKFVGEQANRITRIHSKLSKHEDFWTNRLLNLEQIENPYARRHSLKDNRKNYSEKQIYTAEQFLPIGNIAENTGDLLLAAFILYLYRITDKEKLDINFRDDALKQAFSGTELFFASHIPLRIEVEPWQNFWEFNKTVLKKKESIKKYGTYARDLILRTPSLNKAFSNTLELPVAVERVKNLANYHQEIDADLIVVIPDDGKACLWRYDEKILESSSIKHMQDQFAVLINDIAKNQKRSIAAFSLLSERERHKVMVEWNDTCVEHPLNKCLHELFEGRVKRTPEAVAVVFGDEKLTFQELNLRANQLAHYLQMIGVGSEKLVAILMQRSLEMVVGLLGVLKAGGAYLPLDPAYPKERLAFMLKDSDARVLLTQERLLSLLPEHKANVVFLDADWSTFTKESKKNLPCKQKAGDLAYVIYTSGSTGQPKGVLVSHESLVNHSLAISRLDNIQTTDRILQLSTISFDVAAEEIFPTLLNGAAVVLYPDSKSVSFSTFLRFVKDEQLTILNLPATYWHELVSELVSCQITLSHELRLVVIGSERVSLKKLQLWQKLVGNRIRLLNAYGTTETTITSTVYEPFNNDESMHSMTVPIGRPIANTHAYLLDKHLYPVPIGVPGELYIGGAGVSKGYLNRPELTAEKFVPNPFIDDPTARLYRTGDICRYLQDGNIEFLGRIDHQVKIRGFRIELGEIEAVLSRHPSIREVVVATKKYDTGDKQLVAYIVQTDKQTSTDHILRNYLKNKLPEYMVPSFFVILDALPLTPNEKVDRQALPAPKRLRPKLEPAYVRPRNEIERVITAIWQEVLDLDEIGMEDNFFDLGGHSLRMAQVHSRLCKRFQRDLSMSSLFQYPTIRSLAQHLCLEESEACSLLQLDDRADRVKDGKKRLKKLFEIRLQKDSQEKGDPVASP